jgi:hypothetical protein
MSYVAALQVYQDLCKKHTTFRERSENVDLAVSVVAVAGCTCSYWSHVDAAAVIGWRCIVGLARSLVQYMCTHQLLVDSSKPRVVAADQTLVSS